MQSDLVIPRFRPPRQSTRRQTEEIWIKESGKLNHISDIWVGTEDPTAPQYLVPVSSARARRRFLACRSAAAAISGSPIAVRIFNSYHTLEAFLKKMPPKCGRARGSKSAPAFLVSIEQPDTCNPI